MAPKTGDTDVHRKGLLSQATTWDDQARAIGGISTETHGMKVTGVDAGVFSDVVSVYNKVTDEVGTWTGEGKTVMLKITQALCDAARKYNATEQEIINATHGDIH
jgi:hypothetical protein